MIDLTILAALLRKKQLPQRIGWEMKFFLSDQRARITRGKVPKQIGSIYNTRSVRGGRIILGLISGGVVLKPQQAIESIPIKRSDDSRLNQRHLKTFDTITDNTHPWWWD